jgi:hypothetical protein
MSRRSGWRKIPTWISRIRDNAVNAIHQFRATTHNAKFLRAIGRTLHDPALHNARFSDFVG